MRTPRRFPSGPDPVVPLALAVVGVAVALAVVLLVERPGCVERGPRRGDTDR